jgi:YgiT-type zinc finger domain-containing protein
MKCVICKHGETQPGSTTVTMQRGRCTVVVRGVPADICDNCGEYYLSEEAASAVLLRAQAAAANGAEVELAGYSAG